MSTRFIFRGLDPEVPTGDAVSVSFNRSGTLVAKLDNGAGTIESRPIPLGGVEKVTASKTLTPSDHGKVLIADSTTSVVLTLPSSAAYPAGLQYTLVLEQITAGTGHAFSPNAVDMITGNGLTAVDDKDLICTGATDRVGDAITIVSDGELGWYITSVVGTWAKEA